MKKLILIMLILGLFTSCEEPKDTKKTRNTKVTIDSLAKQKENKKEEILKLNSELDSLRKISDSLKSITE